MLITEPLVSIIVSVYNGESYLRECIESVLNQDYRNIELIAVDDGSIDSSGRILDEYARKDTRMVVVHKENSGVSISRNVALGMAKGAYVALLDQDDVLSRDHVSYLYALICAGGAQIALTPHPKKFFGKLPLPISKEDSVQVYSGIEMAKRMLFHKIVIAPWNKLISRDLIEKNKIRFDKRFFNGEGFAFSIECFLKADKISSGNKYVYYYRVGDPNSGASVFKEAYIHSSIQAQEYIREILIKEKVWDELSGAWRFSNWHTHCDALNLMVGCRVNKEYGNLYRKIRSVCQSQALCALKAPVSFQQRIRGVLFEMNPYMAAKIINLFRTRRFAVQNVNKCKLGG